VSPPVVAPVLASPVLDPVVTAVVLPGPVTPLSVGSDALMPVVPVMPGVPDVPVMPVVPDVPVIASVAPAVDPVLVVDESPHATTSSATKTHLGSITPRI